MDRLDNIENESVSKGNSEDSLLPIYILQVLKKYSSPKNPLSSQSVMGYLKADYSISVFDISDPKRKEKAIAQQKKVRRHLDTLCKSYCHGCIKKIEGNTRTGHRWYYDIDKDKDNNVAIKATVEETLSNEEIDFLVDIITSSKIINSESTSYIIKNLLKKSKLSKDERTARLRKIENEKWQKSINDDLGTIKQDIQSCINDGYKIRFDYEEKKSILVSPHGWGSDENGKYTLIAKTEGAGEGEFSYFVLDKIENLEKTDSEYYCDDAYYDRYFGNADELSIDSLFSNIKIINDAIKSKKGIEFEYLYYAIIDERVDVTRKDKRVLPHRLVFNDGKYYLIGYDEEESKVNYYRVDLISKLSCSNSKINISYYNERMMDGMEIAREIEKHPLMLAERDYLIKFKVAESALDRVIDAFGKNAHGFEVLDETRAVGDSSERLVKFEVRTSKDEAFRWSLSNADVVELVSPQDVRDRLGRIADPIHNIYAKTMADRVRENIDFIRETGMFKITMNVKKDVAFETFKELKRKNDLSVVDKIHIAKIEGETDNYFGEFVNAKYLCIGYAQNCKNPTWASKLTKIASINIFKTQINDVSWLSAMKKLRYVEITESPICDLSALKDHKHILYLDISNTLITDIRFLENYEHLGKLDISGCPIKDHSPLLKIRPLDYLVIDEKAVEALGMDNLIKHHPDAVIKVQQKVDNRKV